MKEMKKTISIMIFLIAGISIGLAQTLSDLFKDDDFLTSVFVSPLGIPNLTDATDIAGVEEKIKESGNAFQLSSLGPFGEVYRISTENMTIGKTPIATMALCTNKDSLMLIYLSESTDSYYDMFESLDMALSRYSNTEDKHLLGKSNYRIHMLTNQYGIAIGTDQDRQISLACLLDIKNLQGFIGLGTLMGN